MKKFFLIAFLSLVFSGLVGTASAQDFHCHKAWKKDWKADRKEDKIHKKMFHDHGRKAEKKQHKAYRKEYKTERKEYEHRHGRKYERYW